MSRSAIGFDYDVFISYSHRDADWVDRILLPALKEAGLRILVDKQLLVGEILLESIEKAVRSSRHILVVLTKAWFESPWAHYEELLASSFDLQRRSRKVIPLLLEKCQLSDRLALLIYADFTDPDRYKEVMDLLLRSLLVNDLDEGTAPIRSEAIHRPPVPGELVRRGLVALCELMHRSEILQAVVEFRIHFEEACRQIDTLGDYKDQHDLLDRLQNHCYDHILRDAPYFPGDKRASRGLRAYDQTLQEILEELRAIVTRRRRTLGEEDLMKMDWIEDHLAPARESLDLALGTADTKDLHRSIWHLDRVLSMQPSHINTQLNFAARAMRLPQLVQSLRAICGGLSVPGLDPEPVRRFEDGVATLAQLNQNLAGLVIDHDRWQLVDLELRRIEINLEEHPEELNYSWPMLTTKLSSLCRDVAEAWATNLDSDRERLTKILQERGLDGDPAHIQDLFWNCRRRVTLRFSQVDMALKEQCDELRKVAEPLAAVLRFLT